MGGNCTVMNLQIGFICEVATTVTNEDKDAAMMRRLKHDLNSILECYDKNGDQCLGKAEFKLLLQDPEIIDILERFGTDVCDLVSLGDLLFEDQVGRLKRKMEAMGDTSKELSVPTHEARLSFKEFLRVIMRLKGQHTSRVTDIVELREFMRQRLDRLEDHAVCSKKRPSSGGDDKMVSLADTRSKKSSDGDMSAVSVNSLGKTAHMPDIPEVPSCEADPPWAAILAQLEGLRAGQKELRDGQQQLREGQL